MASLVVLIGPSKGFGKALLRNCLENPYITRVGNRAVFILVTTNRDATANTWNELYEEMHGVRFSEDLNCGIDVLIEETDLSNTNKCLAICEVLRISLGHLHSLIDRFFLFLNSGSATPVGPILVPDHHKEALYIPDDRFMVDVQTHCILNFISTLTITRLLLNSVLGRKPSSEVLEIRIVNVSSLAAIHEIYGLAVYGAIKAARDSFIRSLAMEVARGFPSVDCKFLSYAPGLMATDLVDRNLLMVSSPPNEIRDSPQKFVDPNESAKRCISLIVDKSFSWTSGAHIDVYDEIKFNT